MRVHLDNLKIKGVKVEGSVSFRQHEGQIVMNLIGHIPLLGDQNVNAALSIEEAYQLRDALETALCEV